MSKRLLSILGGIVLSLASASSILAQQTTTTVTTQTTPTTVTQTTQNPDGSYTVVEYPVGKEVNVTLTPTGTLSGATGTATIMRMANGTTIKLNMAGLPTDLSTVNVYAVDPMGALTLLGPVTVNNGTGTFTTTTPLNKFMLIASPEGNLTAISDATPVLFRSAVPEGLTIVPMARKGRGPNSASGEKVAAIATNTGTTTTITDSNGTTTTAPVYNIPILNIPSFPVKKETQMKVNFADTLHVRRTDFYITPNFNGKGATRVKAKFHELEGVPQGAFLTLWAVGADGSFVRLGSTPNSGHPNVATIDTDVNNTNVILPDFGLFMTVEPAATAASPSGPVVVKIMH